jgi:hypothetical protein
MKNVLIPTDFSVKSLKLVTAAVDRFKGELLNITLVHALEPDYSISGMLMLRKRKSGTDLYTQEFKDACEVLRNKYSSSIHKMVVDFYYGTTKYYRNSYLEGRDIHAIIFPSDYRLLLPSKASNDMMEIFGKKTDLIYYEKIIAPNSMVMVDEDSLFELLIA